MLQDIRETLTSLYDQKIRNFDVKSFIKNLPYHPLGRSIAAIIADVGATFAGKNIMTQFNDTFYKGQSPLYSERNEVVRNYIEQEGLLQGMLKYETEKTIPTMVGYPGISAGVEFGLKKACSNKSNSIAQGFGKILGKYYFPSIALDTLNLYKFGTALRIYWEFIATSNLPHREILATIGAVGLALPYLYSLNKYYWDRIKTDLNMKDFKHVRKNLKKSDNVKFKKVDINITGQ